MTIPNAELNAIRGRQLRALAYWDQVGSHLSNAAVALEVVNRRDVPALLLALADLTVERDELAKPVDSDALAGLRAEVLAAGERIAELEGATLVIQCDDPDHGIADREIERLNAEVDRLQAAAANVTVDTTRLTCDISRDLRALANGERVIPFSTLAEAADKLDNLLTVTPPSLEPRRDAPTKPASDLEGEACTHWAHYTSGTQLHATSKQLAVDHLRACVDGPDLADIERLSPAEKAVLEAAAEWRTVEAEGIAAGRPTVYGTAHAAHAIRRLERAVDGLAGTEAVQ